MEYRPIAHSASIDDRLHKELIARQRRSRKAIDKRLPSLKIASRAAEPSLRLRQRMRYSSESPRRSVLNSRNRRGDEYP